jgi:hypothetical protein
MGGVNNKEMTMKFYIVHKADNIYEVIGTREYLPPLPKRADILAADHDLRWTVEGEETAIMAVTALDAGYNLHRKVIETPSSNYSMIAVTK